MGKAVAAIAVACLASATVAQTQPTPSAVPLVGVMQNRASASPAEALFVEKCGMCHREMGMGTLTLARRVPPGLQMLEKRSDLTREFVIAAARHGTGNMPRISRGEVSDRQLAVIATYLAGQPK